jgi:hypothetical protein
MKNNLFINPHDDVLLDRQYHFSHNIAVKLIEDLENIITDKKIVSKFKTKFTIDKSDIKSYENAKCILDWFKAKGYESEYTDIVSKTLIFFLISDISDFIYQALDSAMNNSTTVALALLRKPFLENLTIIEQLLTEENNFVTNFQKNPKNYDPMRLKSDTKAKLIKKSLDYITTNYLLQYETINELRWDKNNVNSIYASSNSATHLVTTYFPSFKTNNNNFNFIFSGDKERDSQLGYFYFAVTYLLYYVNEIVDQYLIGKKIISLKIFKERKFIRLFGQLLLFDQSDYKSIKGKSELNKLLKDFKVACKNCKKINQLYKSDLFYLVHDDYLYCKHCMHDLFRETKSMNKIIDIMIKK